MLVGSMATGLATGGGFCAGSFHVCNHQVSQRFQTLAFVDLDACRTRIYELNHDQRINSSASVFSAALPAMLATTASAAMGLLQSNPTLTQSLQSNILLFRQILSKLEPLPLPTPSDSPMSTLAPPVPNKDAIISIPSHPNSALIHIFLLDPPPTMEEEEILLQEVVDETLAKTDLLITRARRLRGQETFEPEPSLKVCVTRALSRKEIEKGAKGLREALIKVAGSESSLSLLCRERSKDIADHAVEKR